MSILFRASFLFILLFYLNVFTQANGLISGVVFNDVNGNGIKDVGELGLSNWIIVLGGTKTDTTSTDLGGNYSFPNLFAGNYTVHEVLKNSFVQTVPSSGNLSITLSAEQVSLDNNIGNYLIPPVDASLFTFRGIYNKHLYFLSTSYKTWSDAKLDCENNLGHLVTIADNGENSFISNLVAVGNNIWLGFTDEGHEGNWVWITGEPVTFRHWARFEPNNGGGYEHYAITNWGSTGDWNDIGGGGQQYYVLELDSLHPPQLSSIRGINLPPNMIPMQS